jgi:hypothetical protein
VEQTAARYAQKSVAYRLLGKMVSVRNAVQVKNLILKIPSRNKYRPMRSLHENYILNRRDSGRKVHTGPLYNEIM